MADSRKFLMLIADCPDRESLALNALRRSGIQHEVVTVHDGTEAIEFLEDAARRMEGPAGHLPSLILFDLSSPHVDRCRILRQLRGNPASRLIPVTVLISSVEKQDIEQGFDCGANSLVLRPPDDGLMAETLAQIARYWLDINETAA